MLKIVWLRTSLLSSARLPARWWGWVAIFLTVLFPAAAGRPLADTPVSDRPANDLARFGVLIGRTLIRAPVSGNPASVSEELLVDPSVQEPLQAGPAGIVRESMLEGPIPEDDLPPPELEITKRSPLTLALDPFLLIFSADATATYDDNIFLTHRNREADMLYTLTPRVVVGTGDYGAQKESFVAGGFAPTFGIFQDHSKESDIEYDTFLSAQYSLSRLKLGSRLSYQKLTGADRDATGRIKRDLYIADFIAEYALSQRTTVEVDGQATHRYYSTRIDSNEYFGRTFLAYLFSQKLQTALGGTYNEFRPATRQNQRYEELLLRLFYQPSPKLSFRAIGGVDLRQFEEGTPGRNTPIADIAVAYLPSPSENTVLAINGSRRVQNSATDPTQNYVSNGIAFHVTQRIWRDLYLDLGTGYQRISYYPVVPGILTNRRDGLYFIRPKIRYDFNKWGSISMFCSWRNNDSTVVGNSWKNEQIGVELTVGF